MNRFVVMAAIAVLAGSAGTAVADVVGNARAAQGKVAMCIGCHGIPGYRAAFPQVYKVPMLGGQNAKYLENALQGYKKGSRKFAPMEAIAKSLTDQDIADLAAYYAAQTPESRPNPQR
ncbi:c-type cytochrome [Mycetohabitans sp. B46]|uniref:c-type cytochrome n=1 Tax=Mycetohabitans sp. B46 TaxID=2772536 RepID=UPI00307EA3C7